MPSIDQPPIQERIQDPNGFVPQVWSDWFHALFANEQDYAETFLELDDTPSAYTSEGGKVLQVNSGEDAVEFTDSIDLAGTLDVTGISTFDDDITLKDDKYIELGTTKEFSIGYDTTRVATVFDSVDEDVIFNVKDYYNSFSFRDGFTEFLNLSVGGVAVTAGTKVTVDSITATTGGSSGTVNVESNFSVNTTKFTVNRLNGNTAVSGTLDVTGIATLGDGSLLATSAAPTTDAMIANKKYVDDQLTAQDLDGTTDSGDFTVDLDSQTFTVAGGTNIGTTGSGQTATVNLDDNVDLAGTLDVTGAVTFDSTLDVVGALSVTNNINAYAGATLTGRLGSNGILNLYYTGSGKIRLHPYGNSYILNDNFGFGTNSPDSHVEVSGSGTQTVKVTETGSAVENILRSTSGQGEIGTITNHPLYIRTNNQIAITIDASQNALFYGNLDVNGNIDPTSYETTNGGFKDEDDMISDSATATASQQSIKAYVDTKITAEDLDFQGDSGTGAVDLDSQVLDIAGGTNVTTAASGQTLTVHLDDSINLAGTLDAVGAISGATLAAGSGTSISLIEASGGSDTIDNATLWTSQHASDYLTEQLNLADLDFQGDSGTGSVLVTSQVFDIEGGTNVTTSASGQTLTVNLDDSINLAGTLDVTGVTTLNDNLRMSKSSLPVFTQYYNGIVPSSTEYGRIQVQGLDTSSNPRDGAKISFESDTQQADSLPTDIIFYVTQNNALQLQEALRINHDKSIEIASILDVGEYLALGTDPPNPTGADQAYFGVSASSGAVVIGQGTTYDVALQNESGETALAIPTNTKKVDVFGDLRIRAADRFYLDGGGDTYFYEQSADYVFLVSNGSAIAKLGDTQDIDFLRDVDITGTLDVTGIIASTGTEISVTKANSGAAQQLICNNTSNTANSEAKIVAEIAGTSASYAYTRYVVSGSDQWSTGIDATDSNKFKIALAEGLGSNVRMTVLTSGEVGIGTELPTKPLEVSAAAPIQVRISDSDAPNLGLDLGYDATGTTTAYLYNTYSSNPLSAIALGFGSSVGSGDVVTILQDGASIAGTLDVTGNLTLTGNGTDDIYMDIVSAGETTRRIGIDVSEDTFILGRTAATDISINSAGNVTVSGTLDVVTEFTVNSDRCVIDSSGNIDSYGTLDVDGAATMASLTVDDGSTIGSDTTAGAITIASTGAIDLSSTLDVTGAATLDSTLDVVGIAALQDDLTLIDDKNIEFGNSTDAQILWDGTNQEWEFTLNTAGITAAHSDVVFNIPDTEGYSNFYIKFGVTESLKVTNASTRLAAGHTLYVDQLGDAGAGFILSGDAIVMGNNTSFYLEPTLAHYVDYHPVDGFVIDATSKTTIKSNVVIGDGSIQDYTLSFISSNGTGIITWDNTLTEFNFDSNVSMDGTLDVTGAVDFSSTLQVDGNVTFGDNSAADVTLTFDSSNGDGVLKWDNTLEEFNFDRDVTMDGTLDVTGATTFTNTLTASGLLVSEAGRQVKTTLIDNTDSPYTVLSTDHVVYCDTDGGAITVNLPAGADGNTFRIINTGSGGNHVTLVANGTEKMNGSTDNIVIIDGDDAELVYETTEGWW